MNRKIFFLISFLINDFYNYFNYIINNYYTLIYFTIEISSFFHAKNIYTGASNMNH